MFRYKENEDMVSHMIGPFEFKHHDGPGYYTFAPRFHKGSRTPTVDREGEAGLEGTIPPLDPSALPGDMSGFAQRFVGDAAGLGISVASCPPGMANWHLDGQDYNSTMGMNMLWGSYLVDLPRGNMGNLLVYPGSHWHLAQHARDHGASWVYDGKTRGPAAQPSLDAPGVCEQQPFQVCAQAGDVVLAHPWLAHGIGYNLSHRTRLAVYCRVYSQQFYWPPGSSLREAIAGQSLGAQPWTPSGPSMRWTGDMWAGLPGVQSWLRAPGSGAVWGAFDGGAMTGALEGRGIHARHMLPRDAPSA
jgi:hypothetical protein